MRPTNSHRPPTPDIMSRALNAPSPRPIPPPSPPRNRDWERANKPHSYRIDPEIHAAMKQIRDTLNADGDFHTTLDLVAQSLLDAALRAWEQGRVSIDGKEIRRASRKLHR